MLRAPVIPRQLVLLGHPVRHSFSAAFQNAALRHSGIPVEYRAVDVEPGALDTLLDDYAMSNAGVGGNVTIPHKEAVARRATCSAVATRVGAVNTFWHVGHTLYGHNTDVEGVVSAIASVHATNLAAARCAVLGAGGSAAAVLVALDTLGCRNIHMAARTPERVTEVASRVGVAVHMASSHDDAVRHADLVFNATPVGLTDESMPVPVDALRADATVIDLICKPHGTALVQACSQAGLIAIDGTTMLLAQGAAAFTSWFGVPAPMAVMKAALRDALERSGSAQR